MRTENIFVEVVEAHNIDIIEINMLMGNFNYIYLVKDPHSIAQFLKAILKYLAEPICTFRLIG